GPATAGTAAGTPNPATGAPGHRAATGRSGGTRFLGALSARLRGEAARRAAGLLGPNPTAHLAGVEGRMVFNRYTGRHHVRRPRRGGGTVAALALSGAAGAATLLGTGTAAHAASGVNWDAIAQCESSGNWHIN